ncbi:MAG TPA: two-component regulator propeller domain-containing protein, partial [Opitutaceae bacterium]|nr:two-component regulator propeller domain-containing protein [Opitutaceae bacterium]
MAQDRDGVLYFGSDVLLQYNGAMWKGFPIGNNPEVFGLAVDEQGRIWLGGRGIVGYCDKDPAGLLHYTSLLSRLPAEHRDQLTIWGVQVTSRGVVFAASNKIIRWDGKSFRIWPLPDTRRTSSQKIGDA